MLQPEWVGRRVSVRRVVERAADGRLLQGDVVGRLVGLDSQTAVVDTRTGLVEVPVALVTAARDVPPSTADELELQDVAARGWPAADTEQLDGWLLRADPGGTRRANSVNPVGQLRTPLDAALEQVHAFYARHGRPVLFQLPSEARRLLGAELAERGWLAEGPTAVLVTELAPPSGGDPGVDVAVTDAPDDAWLAMPINADDHPAARRALLTRHPDTAFAAVRVDGELAATGRATVDADWLGITTVEVREADRHCGLARAVVGELQQWGRTRGAARAYVQVATANQDGQQLFAALGYRHHHDYHYLREPGPS